MHGLAKEARSLHARLAAGQGASRTKASKLQAKDRTADLEEVVEPAHVEYGEHTI